MIILPSSDADKRGWDSAHPAFSCKEILDSGHSKGKRGWDSAHPAFSCKEILDSGHSKGDGEYWIDPEKSGNPLKVSCDMSRSGGGWLLVSNVEFGSPSPKVSIKTSYRGIGKSHMVLQKSAMKELRRHLSFTQLRFHCRKKQGRTFHVVTASNSSGEAVVRYFSGQTDEQPDACGSFVRLSWMTIPS
ncbi:unnamed protein product [Pocillopora meandrina]|uniref:Fibrinogen C-terminal domain-containing protein n=1 Tax=Pocillopora meandrina TaxID=46732 RepID=A0AAU9W0Z5_9CNID|nr:unnamed protein product [Pocillopora meandrina]